MAWTDQDPNYSMQGVVYFTLHAFNLSITSFTIAVGRTADIRMIVGKLLKELDNQDLVKIESTKDEETEKRYGNTQPAQRYARFDVHKDDIAKVFDPDAEIRIKLFTNAFPNSKEAFVDFFKEFYNILSW